MKLPQIISHFIFLIFFNTAFSQVNVDSLLAIWYNSEASDMDRLESVSKALDTYESPFPHSYPDSMIQISEDELELAKKVNSPLHIVLALDHKIFGMFWTQPPQDSIQKYADLSRQIAFQSGDTLAMITALSIMGAVAQNAGDNVQSYRHIMEAINLAQEAGKIAIEANMHMHQGYSLTNIDEDKRSTIHLRRALQLYEQLGKKEQVMRTSRMLGRSFHFLRAHDSAKVYLNQALDLANELKVSQQDYINISHRLAMIYETSGEHEEALKLALQGIQKDYQTKNMGYIRRWHFRLAKNYFGLDQNDLSLSHLDSAIIMNEENKNLLNKVFNWVEYGELLYDLEKTERGRNLCEKAYEIALEQNSLVHLNSSCRCLYKTNKKLGNSAEALKFQELMLSYEDSLGRDKKSKEIQQIEFQQALFKDSIEHAKITRNLEEEYLEDVRKKEKSRNIAFTLGLIALLFALAFYSRWKYVRKSKSIIEKEKERSENLLLNILPEEIAQELKEKGKAEARNFDLVSILFTDFKDFTQKGSKLSASDLVNEINKCFEAFDNIIEKHSIEKIKTIGDAYMAAGGLPVPSDDAVKNTVLSAIEMQDFISKRKSEMDALGKQSFEMRVGIHTGPVVAGIVGVKKFQYDIWGDTVNTASRMENQGAIGKVNISQSTYELLKDDPDFTFESRGKIEVKGKGEMQMYFVELK